jgi:hypothetical protein
MVRKRAPGGGRKPIGSTVAQPVTIRMPDDMRDRLELASRKRAKRKPGWNLSQEILCRLRRSMDKEREDQSPIIRDVCYLISEMAKREFYAGHHFEDRPWHRDPFMFRAFKLAVAKILDELKPPGEMRPPREKYNCLFSLFTTPESLADHAARKELHRLFHENPLTQAEKAIALQGADDSLLRGTEYDPFLVLAELEAPFHVYPKIRRDLGIEEPKEWKSWRDFRVDEARGIDEPKEPKS